MRNEAKIEKTDSFLHVKYEKVLVAYGQKTESGCMISKWKRRNYKSLDLKQANFLKIVI